MKTLSSLLLAACLALAPGCLGAEDTEVTASTRNASETDDGAVQPEHQTARTGRATSAAVENHNGAVRSRDTRRALGAPMPPVDSEVCPPLDPGTPSAEFCSELCPCNLGQGDCDDHTECAPGLFCGGDNGPEFGLAPGWDVCTGGCPVFDRAHPSPTFCSELCPCALGQGDCDQHSECAPGLVCGADNGAEFGLPSGWDACTDRCPSFDRTRPSPTFCSDLCPCALGQGDCDQHYECATGLVCGSDNGPEFDLPPNWEACTNRCPAFDRAVPSPTFCSERCPCRAGQGDCDSDSECAPGLTCSPKSGHALGLPDSFDVCTAAVNE